MMISHATTIVYLLSFTVRFSSAFPGLNHLLLREICYENDILQSFQTWEADSIPYCSSLLGISDYTLFEGPTKTQTTTLSTVTATSYDTIKTVTEPQVTAFTTATITSILKLHKRQGIIYSGPLEDAPLTTTLADPVRSIFPSMAQNDSIAAAAYSACSCLRIHSSTVTAQPTVQITRTIFGIDYEVLETTTVTDGTTTITTTVSASYNASSSSTSTPSLGFPLSGSLIPTSPANFSVLTRPFPTLNITAIPVFSVSAGIFPSVNASIYPTGSISAGVFPSVNASAYPIGSVSAVYPTAPRSGFLPSPTTNSTANSTLPRSGLFPTPTANSTANMTRPSSGFYPRPTANSTTNMTLPSSGFYPKPTANLTANITLPRSGFFPQPTANSTGNFTLPASGLFPLPTVNLTTNFNSSVSGRLPPPILNGTAPSRPFYPVTGSIPLPTLNVTNGTFPISGDPSSPTKVVFPSSDPFPIPTLSSPRSSARVPLPSISTTYPFLPVGTQISSAGCPSINNTVYTVYNETGGDRYRLQCSVQYAGRSFADLDEPDLEGCIQKCSNINADFSQVVCQGLSFLQYSTGFHCVLLAQTALSQSSGNKLAISALLLAEGGEPVVGASPSLDMT